MLNNQFCKKKFLNCQEKQHSAVKSTQRNLLNPMRAVPKVQLTVLKLRKKENNIFKKIPRNNHMKKFKILQKKKNKVIKK